MLFTGHRSYTEVVIRKCLVARIGFYAEKFTQMDRSWSSKGRACHRRAVGGMLGIREPRQLQVSPGSMLGPASEDRLSPQPSCSLSLPAPSSGPALHLPGRQEHETILRSHPI